MSPQGEPGGNTAIDSCKRSQVWIAGPREARGARKGQSHLSAHSDPGTTYQVYLPLKGGGN